MRYCVFFYCFPMSVFVSQKKNCTCVFNEKLLLFCVNKMDWNVYWNISIVISFVDHSIAYFFCPMKREKEKSMTM